MHEGISSGREELRLEYKPDTTGDELLNKLSKNHDKDISYGSTSNGVHKDDIIFYINDINARLFGSQGQQRSACLSTKLAEIELIKSEKGENPVLLLDDVLSELDKLRQNSLVEAIGDIQTIITCTGIEDSIRSISEKSKIFTVKNGKIL
jgi:DNA replication and repair protein RecF